MAEKTIIICDRCGTRTDDDVSVVRVQRGDARKLRDLCPLCVDDLERFFSGRALEIGPKHVRESRAEDPEAQLAEARRMAREAVLGYQDGDHPQRLVETLTDIQSGARRR